MGAIFRLEHPVYGQTHGCLCTRFDQFSNGTATKIVYVVGKVVAEEFVEAEGIEEVVRVLGAEDLEAFFDFVQAQGQPVAIRGQYRDTDMAAWFAGGNGA